jgi:hypothetical protein
MLLLRPSFAIGTNVVGEIWTAHVILCSLGTSSKGQTPRFPTLKFVQRLEVDLHEHIRTVNMFKHAIKYNVYMTNILLIFSNL